VQPATRFPTASQDGRGGRGASPLRPEKNNRYSCASGFGAYIIREVGGGGAYAPPLPNFQTGMPSFRALSAKFS
jgi:hypothetical protein